MSRPALSVPLGRQSPGENASSFKPIGEEPQISLSKIAGNGIRNDCDSLFDDESTLSTICFNVEDTPLMQTEGHIDTTEAYCTATSSSCCSLCRAPFMSEITEDGMASNPATTASAVDLSAFTQHVHEQATAGNANADGVQPFNSPRLAANVLANVGVEDCLCRHTFSYSCCVACACDGKGSSLPIKIISIPSTISMCAKNASTLIEITMDGLEAAKESVWSCRDYLSTCFLPHDALLHTFSFVDVRSLVRLRASNRWLKRVVSSDEVGWKVRCESLWAKKANVCLEARDIMRTCSPNQQQVHHVSPPAASSSRNAAMEAYKISRCDAAERNEISLQELSFDAVSSPGEEKPTWSFRFKESAGPDWTSWDPWWNGRSERKMVFLKNGTIMQVSPKGRGDGVNVGGTVLYDVFSERPVSGNDNGGANGASPPRIEMKWRFVERPLDLPPRPDGAYIRITVGGRDVPTYAVRRSTNGNWGFILESCWAVYASFELAPRVMPDVGETRNIRRRLRRTRNGSRWVNVSDSETEDYDDDEEEEELGRNVRRRIDLFVEESAMSVSSCSQWREALLYNIGAVSFPEGNNGAMEEDTFDNIVQNSV